MATPSQTVLAPLGRVLVNHIGFVCSARKEVVVRGGGGAFELIDMAQIRPSGMGEKEGYLPVMSGRLRPVDSAFGPYSIGDFSAWTTPGIYRIELPETGERSYQFAITDGAFSGLPPLFLRFVHAWRSGPVDNAWRGPTHLDDARRSDDGSFGDYVGGWYDAGDVRKSMIHSNLPALAFMDAHERLPWHYAEWERVEPGWSPWLLEARWGLDFLLKMQDPQSGMFFEDIGGGGNSRKKPGSSWWYANHSGCYADNADNRFTDNRPGSGDERPLRVQYNPVAQFTSVAILARAARLYAPLDADRAGRYAAAAERGWRLGLNPDPKYYEAPGAAFGGWTSVRSWRCLAAVELHLAGLLAAAEAVQAAEAVRENFDAQLGYWRNAAGEAEPYRAILHSAQPLIALVRAGQTFEGRLRSAAQDCLRACLERYVFPLTALSPFGIVPFGAYQQIEGEGDLYRSGRDGLRFRFFMPEGHPQRINHGLAGHWTSWAHGLALAGEFLGEPKATQLAWSQLHWLTGANPFNATVISGVGYNNPMPHSRFLGAFPGGFQNGFNGSAEDQPQLDLAGQAQWNTTEYWNTPLSNATMALGILNPPTAPPGRKLGGTPP